MTDAEALTGELGVTRQLADLVIDGVLAHLSAIGSSLVVGGQLDQDLEATIKDVLVQTVRRLSDVKDEHSPISFSYNVTSEFAQIAVGHANTHHHPAEPLMAAEVIFAVALPPLVEATEQEPVRASMILHNEIWRRFPPGAIAYVEFILGKLASAHLEERLTVARELHDRVAHKLAAGIQRIDLARIRLADAEGDLTEAARQVRDSLTDVQDIALVLRRQVGEGTLQQAFVDVIERLPAEPTISVTSRGESRRLLASVTEEIFTIGMEAVRNARQHSACKHIEIVIEWNATILLLRVSDDGRGYESSSVGRNSQGLQSMKERAQIIGSALSTNSSPAGTSVMLQVPLGRVVVTDGA